jgi:hypothetical protein
MRYTARSRGRFASTFRELTPFGLGTENPRVGGQSIPGTMIPQETVLRPVSWDRFAASVVGVGSQDVRDQSERQGGIGDGEWPSVLDCVDAFGIQMCAESTCALLVPVNTPPRSFAAGGSGRSGSLPKFSENSVPHLRPRFVGGFTATDAIRVAVDFGEPLVVAGVIGKAVKALEERCGHLHPLRLGEPEPLGDQGPRGLLAGMVRQIGNLGCDGR